jgi:hypothetical protein
LIPASTASRSRISGSSMSWRTTTWSMRWGV